MKVIAVFGRKGGSGKTLVSHFLSHGMAMLDHTTIMMQTDVRENRPVEIHPNRKYMLASTRGDGSDLKMMQKIIDMASKIPGSVLVMDGGANRRNIDIALLPLADLVLLPTGYGPEDIDVAESDHRDLSKAIVEKNSKAEAFIVMNRWPGLNRKLNVINQKPWVNDFLARAQYKKHVFPYFVPDMPSLIDMAHGDDPKYTPLIDGRARAFAKLVERKILLSTNDGSEEAPYREDMSLFPSEEAA